MGLIRTTAFLVCLLNCRIALVSAGNGFLTDDENKHLQSICGKLPPTKKAMNSDFVPIEEAPWAASIKLDGSSLWYKKEENEGLYCSAVLISPRHILTAAHCVNPKREYTGYYSDKQNETHRNGEIRLTFQSFMMNPKALRIATGDACSARGRDWCRSDTSGKAQFRQGRRIWVFPGYNEKDIGDMAIVELESDVPTEGKIIPVCLSTEFPRLREVFMYFGFGAASTKLWDKKVDHLQKITTNVEDCFINGEWKKDWEQRLNTSFCTRNAETQQHVCGGDSGGGFVSLDSNGRYQVRGLTSESHWCNYKTYPTYPVVDHNTGIAPFVPWICDKTGVCPEGHTRRISSGGELIERQKILRSRCDNDKQMWPFLGTNALCFHVYSNEYIKYNASSAREQCREWDAYLAPVRTPLEWMAIKNAEFKFASGTRFPKEFPRSFVDVMWSDEHNEFRWLLDSSKVDTNPKYWVNESSKPEDEFGREAKCLTIKWVAAREAKFEPVTCSHEEGAMVCAKKPEIEWEL